MFWCWVFVAIVVLFILIAMFPDKNRRRSSSGFSDMFDSFGDD